MMTMKFEAGDAKVPLWAVIVVLVSLFIAIGGVYYGWAQKMANADHATISQEIRQINNDLEATHQVDFSQTAGISDMKADIAAIKAMLTDILRRLK